MSPAISAHQLAAMAEPAQSLRELVGNFGELETLFEQLGEPLLIELGTPLPHEKFRPKRRIGGCPAAHNRALLDDEPA
jgi:hypothetical protein